MNNVDKRTGTQTIGSNTKKCPGIKCSKGYSKSRRRREQRVRQCTNGYDEWQSIEVRKAREFLNENYKVVK